METITIIFPEVKLEIPTKGLTFDRLEELVFDISRQIGCRAMEIFLTILDHTLRAERPRGQLRNLGKVFKHILTRLGDVNYNRTRYEDKSTGEIRYLADELLGLERDQRISLSRKKLEAHTVSEVTYRQAKESMKRITGSSRSHEAMRQSVIKEAEKIIGYQDRSLKKIRHLEYNADIEAPETVYSEADGTVIRLQHRGKNEDPVKARRKRHAEVKLGIGYTGRRARYSGGEGTGRLLDKKFVHVSMKSRDKFMEEFSLLAEKRLNLSKAKRILFGGDGDEWIKRGVGKFFAGAKYLLCRYHLQKAITTGMAGMKQRIKEVRALLGESAIDEAIENISEAIRSTDDPKRRETLEDLRTYIRNNREGILASNELGENEDKTGAIEPNIDKVIAQRMKNRGMSWSRKGAISLLKIKETIINGDWNNWWREERDKTVRINSEWKKPLPATCFKKPGKQIPWIETAIPALEGGDQDKPWARVLRKLTESRYNLG